MRYDFDKLVLAGSETMNHRPPDNGSRLWKAHPGREETAASDGVGNWARAAGGGARAGQNGGNIPPGAQVSFRATVSGPLIATGGALKLGWPAEAASRRHRKSRSRP